MAHALRQGGPDLAASGGHGTKMPGMHEFSIADALAEQVRRHATGPGRVREVEIRVGALRGLEPESLSMCWQAVTAGTSIEGSVLRVDLRPWSISCPACGREWTSPVPFVTCACGEAGPVPRGGDELDLVALVVDDEDGEDEDPERE
jgi:hydrogenase nickel incorporation protein HypA/HybF